jgi:hypothetical protein
LNWEGIEEIVKEGIKLKTGEVVPLDVIIFGTGYSLVSCFPCRISLVNAVAIR